MNYHSCYFVYSGSVEQFILLLEKPDLIIISTRYCELKHPDLSRLLLSI